MDYPLDQFIPNPDGTLTREYDDFSGKRVTTIYQPILVIEERDDCFCCSCGEREGSDPACRSHGDYGKRPCEEHGMPGYTWEDEGGGDSGVMPASVQAARAGDRS